MKSILMSMALLISLSSKAEVSPCKTKALNVAKAVDKVFTPKLKPGTKISTEKTTGGEGTEQWVVSFVLPNSEGQTVYNIEMQKISCEIVNLQQITEANF